MAPQWREAFAHEPLASRNATRVLEILARSDKPVGVPPFSFGGVKDWDDLADILARHDLATGSLTSESQSLSLYCGWLTMWLKANPTRVPSYDVTIVEARGLLRYVTHAIGDKELSFSETIEVLAKMPGEIQVAIDKERQLVRERENPGFENQDISEGEAGTDPEEDRIRIAP